MQWSNLLAKLSPERIQPILREGQCNPVSDYTKTPNMPAGHHDSPPEPPEADDQDGSSSIGDSSLLAPPTSHRRQYSYSGPQRDPYELHSLLDGLSTSHDPPGALATTTFTLGSPAASLGPIRTVAHSDYLDGTTLPNPHPLSPHLSWLPGRVSPPMVPPPHQSLVYPDGYAPAESLPPQHYVSPARTVPPPSAPFFHPRSGATSLFSQAQVATPPNLNLSPTAVVPPNSELARTPRFTFAPPGTDVPADPIASTTAASPTSARSWRDKAKARLDKTSQQPTQEGSSGRRARSNSWTVVSSVFRRRSGRQPGPAPLTAIDAPPQLIASNWRDLAQWAYRPIDHTWGESFALEMDISLPIEREAISSLYDHSLPPLPSHLSHLPTPSVPLMRTNSSMSALNPFLLHRTAGLAPLAWDLRTAARSILFPASGPGAPAVPMAASDYAQPATWPPTGALRIGAIGGHAGWRWPVDVRNPVGVRCGDVFRALVANLHEFVPAYELADMAPENVRLMTAACAARVDAGFPHGSGARDGIRRVDCLLGYTLFHGLEPGPGTGEWTMFVGPP